MNLELTEEQKLLQNSVREFAEFEVKPLARELDETGHFPHETFKKAAELGFTGVALPEAEGGAGFDHIAYTIVIEEISRCCASTSVVLSVQNALYCDPDQRLPLWNEFVTSLLLKNLTSAERSAWGLAVPRLASMPMQR